MKEYDEHTYSDDGSTVFHRVDCMARWCDRCIAELNDRCPVCNSHQDRPDMLNVHTNWITCDGCGTKLRMCHASSAFGISGKYYMVTGYIESTGIEPADVNDDII